MCPYMSRQLSLHYRGGKKCSTMGPDQSKMSSPTCNKTSSKALQTSKSKMEQTARIMVQNRFFHWQADKINRVIPGAMTRVTMSASLRSFFFSHLLLTLIWTGSISFNYSIFMSHTKACSSPHLPTLFSTAWFEQSYAMIGSHVQRQESARYKDKVLPRESMCHHPSAPAM